MIKFLKVDWQPKHITFGLFKATNISGQTLTINLTELLDIYGLRRKIVVYVEDEGSNLNIMIATLKSIISLLCWVWKKVFKKLVLVMFFLKCANMQQWMIFFAKALDMYLSKLPKENCRNV